MSGPKLYTTAEGVQDRQAFRTMLSRIGIDSRITTDSNGEPTVAVDQVGMEQLAAWFAGQGDTAQADSIRRALDA